MDIANDLSLLNLSTPPPPPEKKEKTKKWIVNLPTPSPPPAPQKNVKTKKRIIKEPSPIRHHRIVNQAKDVSRFEKVDDCFILGFEPNDVKQVDKVVGSPEIAIVTEKGQGNGLHMHWV